MNIVMKWLVELNIFIPRVKFFQTGSVDNVSFYNPPPPPFRFPLVYMDVGNYAYSMESME